jgi:hypothetical protein
MIFRCIIFTSNILTLSVPDEDYNILTLSVPDESYTILTLSVPDEGYNIFHNRQIFFYCGLRFYSKYYFSRCLSKQLWHND